MIWDEFLSDADRERLRLTGLTGPKRPARRPALLVIDVSWAFAGDRRDEDILESIRRWPNSCGRESWQAIERISELVAKARQQSLPVLYSTGRGRADSWDIGGWAWKNSRTPTPMRDHAGQPDGNEIVPPLAPQPEDIIVYKRKPSAFFGVPMASHLRRLGCDSVLLTGTTTSGCVRATAVDAFSHGFGVTAIADGCFDRSQASHAMALFDIAMRYGTVSNVSQVTDLEFPRFRGRLRARGL